MSKPNPENQERNSRSEGMRREAAANALRETLRGRDARPDFRRGDDLREMQMNKRNMNDLYERSSF